MLGFYMDDSADHKRKTVFSVAGFVIKAGDTFETERPWVARTEREGLDYFRTYDCTNLENHFQEKLVDRYGLTTARVIADAVLADCKSFVASSPMYSYIAGVMMDDYRTVAAEPDGQIVLNEDPYVFVHHLLIGLVLDEVYQWPRAEVVAFLYDEHSKAALLQSSWADYKEANPNWANAAGIIAPLDDKTNPLIQMADLLANTGTRFFLEFQEDPDTARDKLKAWLGGNLMRVVYADARWLREMVAGNVERCRRFGAKNGMYYPP